MINSKMRAKGVVWREINMLVCVFGEEEVG